MKSHFKETISRNAVQLAFYFTFIFTIIWGVVTYEVKASKHNLPNLHQITK